jgi:hypothetical protein
MDTDSPMLLVPAKTGVVYHHQYGGGACLTAEEEGFLVPVSTKLAGEQPYPFDTYTILKISRMVIDSLCCR